MRIALLTTNLQPDNGWATLAVRRGAALMTLGVEIVALTARGDGPPSGISPSDVRPVLPGLQRGNRGLLNILAANPAIDRATADCDLVDVVAEPYALGCLLAERRRPVLVTACGTYIPFMSQQGPFRAVFRRIFGGMTLHAISRYTAGRVSDVFHSQPEVIIPGVDYEFYQPARPQPEKRGPTVLFVGAVKKRKGVRTLIDAVALACQSIPDLQCVIAGPQGQTGYTRLIREQISRLGLQERVQMTGRLPYEAIVGWYQAADLFVMPSLSGPGHFEGFGLVILEAGACGLPAIGSRDSGNESALEDGVSGYLVEQGDPQALAARMVELLNDDVLRRRLGEGARAFARAHSWERSAADLQRFYEGVLAARGEARR